MSPESMKGLFSHEVLVHALRAVNDDRAGGEFETGLPGYLDADEGLGIFVEYAATGKVPDKIIDRYVDIAYALGMIDGVQHTRQVLLNIAGERAIRRNELSDQQKTPEEIETSLYSHVNRIYRGSRGDEHIGIYTKDIVYYVGFMKIGDFIASELEPGKPIDEIMRYLLSGRFDPSMDSHQQCMAARLIK